MPFAEVGDASSALGVRDQDAVVCRLKHVRQVEFHVFVDQEGDAGRWDDSDEVRSESVRSLSVHHIENRVDYRPRYTHPL
jgi:predicted Co/Zn/Cd cation transporter (cation efflux family)